MTRFAASPLPLLCILLLALALRVLGLGWGLPSVTHYFSYHPDETVVLETSSVTMNVFAGRLLPHFYNYGSLQLYLVCFANTLAALFGGVEIVPKALSAWYPQWAKMYFIGRSLTVGMGVGTVWATYALGARLWNRRAGLAAALLLAVMPLHVQHSHFLTVDVPATFWVMLSLVWSARLATDDSRPLRAALFAGLFAGLATATKYNTALAVLPLVTACYLSSPSRFGRAGACAGVGLLSCVLAFFAACPGALLENTIYLKNLRFEAVHIQNGDDPTFRDTGSGFVYHITHNLDAGLGLPLLLLCLVSIGYALYRRQRGDALLAAFALPYYVLIGLAAIRYARYVIPLLPILALWAGRVAADGSCLPRASLRGLTAAVAAGCFFAASLNTAVLTSAMIGRDPRDQALTDLNTFVPQPAHVGFAVQPWFGDVPISPYFTSPGLGDWQSVTPPETRARIAYSGKDWDINALNAQRPDAVVLSEYDYNDALRLKDPAAAAYLAALLRDYQLVGTAPAQGKNAPAFPSSHLPHDMTYTSPIISLYRRKQ